MGDEGGSPWCPNNDDVVHRLVAMSLTVMWHLDLLSEKSMRGR